MRTIVMMGRVTSFHCWVKLDKGLKIERMVHLTLLIYIVAGGYNEFSLLFAGNDRDFGGKADDFKLEIGQICAVISVIGVVISVSYL